METRRNTTPGVLNRTPAPVCSSATSTAMSVDDADEEEEANREFASQMDENGIIGLSGALDYVDLEESCCRSSTREEADPNDHLRETLHEEMNFSGRPYQTESEGEEHQTQPFQGEKDGEEEGKRTDRNKEEYHLDNTSECFEYTHSSTKGFISKNSKQINSQRSNRVYQPSVEPSADFRHHCPASQSSTAASFLPHLFHLTAEELASAPGIDAETFPDMGFTDGLSESHCGNTSPKSSSGCPEMKLQVSPKPAASFSVKETLNHCSSSSHVSEAGSAKLNMHQKEPVPSPRKTKQCFPTATTPTPRSLTTDRKESSKSHRQNKICDPELRTSKVTLNADEESRKGCLSYHTPDFSWVEPRVRFPKDGYQPPKSKHSLRGRSLSPEPPLVFKSPADIVKEVLLNNSDETSSPSAGNRASVPPDFRCRHQATTLLEQLQEDYNRLLTKYAEAENTIDRLRLEAKVNLHSDPPMAGSSVPSELNHNASKLLELNYSPAHKAEMSSADSHPNGHSAPQDSPDGFPSTRGLGHVLSNQADKFLQQVQTFEDFLKSEKLRPHEKIEALSQLTEGLNSLERGYLLIRDEYKLLHQGGAETCCFDPERELEGLIFQCGLRVDELKEQVEPGRQEASGSSPPKPISSSDPNEEEETPSYSQSQTVSSQDGQAEAAQSFAFKSSSEEEPEDKDTLQLFYRRPLINKHRRVVPDISADHFRERHKIPFSAALKVIVKHKAEREEQQGQKATDEVSKTPSKRNAKYQHQDPPMDTSRQRSSRSSPPLFSQSTMLPVLPSSCRRSSEMRRSHSSSLSSIADLASERRSSMAQKGSKRALSQDGIISPETDSGFVGSESCLQISSVLHQRAPESLSVFGEDRRAQQSPAAVASPSSPLLRRMAEEPRAASQLSSHLSIRVRQKGQRRRRLTSPPQCWNSPKSVTIHTGSEVEQSDQYSDSSNSLHSTHLSSSPAARCHHEDRLRAMSFSQVANCKSTQQRSDVSPEGRGTCIADDSEEESTLRDTTREGSTSVPQHRILTESALQPSTPKPLALASRYTQTSAAPDGCCSAPACSTRKQARQPFVSDIADERDSGDQSFLCPRCLSSLRGPADRPGGASGHPTYCCHLCSSSGFPEPHRCTESDLQKEGSYKHLNHRTARSPRRASSRSCAGLPLMSVCPSQLLLYSSPVILSPHKLEDRSTGVSTTGKRTGRVKSTSVSVDKRNSADSSLDRAIKAAQHMKLTSRHMAYSLATGLRYQGLLT
ncbi:uncharacterized protein akna isoform 2-T4 [Menidia menidia]